MKKLLFLFILLCAFGASAQRVTHEFTITNRAVTSNSITVNGSMRYWTNSSTATTIATNLTSVNATKTNLFNQIAAFNFTGFVLQDGNTNALESTNKFRLVGPIGQLSSCLVTGTWGFVISHTQGTAITRPMLWPIASVVGATNQTNQASDSVAAINTYATNSFTTNSPPLSNYVTKGASSLQSVTGPMQFNGRTAIASNFFATNGFTRSLTNINPVTSNLVNYGNSIRSEGTGGNSFQAGSNAVASGANSLAVGNDATASGDNSTAVGISAAAAGESASAFGQGSTAIGDFSLSLGQGATASGESDIGIGVTAAASGGYSVALGTEATASARSSVAVGEASTASAIYSMAVGQSASAVYSNSAAIGPRDDQSTPVSTTQTNQIVIGTSRHAVYIPGYFAGAISNLFTASGQTNVIRGDVSFPRATVTSIANGANRFSIGTNVFVDVTGTPSATWSVDGIIFGTVAPRDGHLIKLRNGTGYDSTFVHNSGLEAVAAYRVATATSTNVIFTNGATAELIYSASAARWLLWSVFSGHDPAVTATATNAVAFLNGSATNLTVYSTASTTPALQVRPGVGVATNIFTIYTTNGQRALTVSSNGLIAYQPPPGPGSNVFSIRHTNAQLNFHVASNGVVEVQPQVGATANIFQVDTTNGAATMFVRSNHTLVASNIAVTPFASEVGVPFRLYTITNSSITTNITTLVSLQSNLLGTASLPANFLKPGMVIRCEWFGNLFGATTTITNRVTLGGTIIATNHVNFAAAFVNDPWLAQYTITCRTAGASGTIRCEGVVILPTAASGVASARRLRMASGDVTVDTTSALALGFDWHPGATSVSIEINSGHALVIP